jgi:hypothetical protein
MMPTVVAAILIAILILHTCAVESRPVIRIAKLAALITLTFWLGGIFS